MTFGHPWWLLAGVALAAAFVWAAQRAGHRARAAAIAYSDLAFFVAATGSRVDPARVVAIAVGLAILAFAGALAAPRVVATLPARGGTIVLCVDTSGSMRATDVEPSRADAAANAVRAFVDGVPDGTRLGIVAFSSAAGVVIPPTREKDAVRDAIDRIPPPNGGTAIGDALAAAARLLPATGRRAIVLVTDGVNNMGLDPLSVAQQIGAAGVEIDTVGIGTNDSGQLIPGTAEVASLDETALTQIATAAHGAYARAADAASLRGRLAALANSTTREKRRIDLAFPLALAGGGVLVAGAGGLLLAGRFP
ncbi:MAG TPA: VWA domain-containing protein [Candidatus Baltobacteraceae bacterium]|nr:VWA domain-containing protein [Candidatus Baltobacteraceae bacterium]